MNTTLKAFWNNEFFGSIRKFISGDPSPLHDDLTVHTQRHAIIEVATNLEGKNIPVVIHLSDGRFFKATVTKVLNGAYLITEETGLLNTKANLVGIKEILSVSVKE